MAVSGGILQLVATGKEDEIISRDPQITLFKNIYRRYVNFDKTEQELSFDSDLTFGKTGTCRIKRIGDLIGTTIMCIELPEISLEYLKLNNFQMSNLLKDYGMTWNYDETDKNILISSDDFNTVVGDVEIYQGGTWNNYTGVLTENGNVYRRVSDGMINDHVNDMNDTITLNKQYITAIDTISDTYIQNNDTNMVNYWNDIIHEMFSIAHTLFKDDDEYVANKDLYYQYDYLYSYKHDLPTLLPEKLIWRFPIIQNQTTIYFEYPSHASAVTSYKQYISTATNNGWTENNTYLYSSGKWTEETAIKYFGCKIYNPYLEIPTIDMFYNIYGINNSFIDFADVNEIVNQTNGDTYIQLHDVTIGSITYTHNNIYIWNGTTQTWNETTPVTGVVLINIKSNTNMTQTIWEYNGSSWIDYTTTTDYNTTQSRNMTMVYDGISWRNDTFNFVGSSDNITIPKSVGDTYMAVQNTTIDNVSWEIGKIYTWNGTTWVINNVLFGDTYIASQNITAGSISWTIGYVYTWNGISWNHRIPTNGYCTYIINKSNIYEFDGYNWNLASLDVELYNMKPFIASVSEKLQNLIFTDTNIALLYAVENCNTAVNSKSENIPLKTFFTSIVENEIGTIDTSCSFYTRYYQPYFSTSVSDSTVTGTQSLVQLTSSILSSQMRNGYVNEISKDITTMEDIIARFNYDIETNGSQDSDIPEFTYYFVDNTMSSSSNSFINCPKIYYNESVSLNDNFVKPIMTNITISNETNYQEYVSSTLNEMTGFLNTTSGLNYEGSLYEVINGTITSTSGGSDVSIPDFLTSFYRQTYEQQTDEQYNKYDVVRDLSRNDTYKNYNLNKLLNAVAPTQSEPYTFDVRYNLFSDLLHFIYGIIKVHGQSDKWSYWSYWSNLDSFLINKANSYISGYVRNPTNCWDETSGLPSKNTDPLNNNLIGFTLFSGYYNTNTDGEYDNEIGHLVSYLCGNLIDEIIILNNELPNTNPTYVLSTNELTDIETKINYIGSAYKIPTKTFADFYGKYSSTDVSVNTNIPLNLIPELTNNVMMNILVTAQDTDLVGILGKLYTDLYVGTVTPRSVYFTNTLISFSRHHYPADGLTAILNYLISTMKWTFNQTCFELFSQTVYDLLGSPMSNVIKLFYTNYDVYTYGPEMYNSSATEINNILSTFDNDFDRYDTFGNVLKIKNIYLDQQTMTYNYPLGCYIEMHKAIYNNQNIYINAQPSGYIDPHRVYEATTNTGVLIGLYPEILTKLNEIIIPMLQYDYYNKNIYSGGLDTISIYLDNTTGTIMTNPYTHDFVGLSTTTGSSTHYTTYQDFIDVTQLDCRIIPYLNNPYNITSDLIRHEWYYNKIVVNILEKEVTYSEGTTQSFIPMEIGTMKFYDSVITSDSASISKSNIYLYDWYNDISQLSNERRIEELNKMHTIFSLPYLPTNTSETTDITPTHMYMDSSNIETRYNNFAKLSDFIQYLIDTLIIKSQLGSIISLQKATVDATRNNLINYYRQINNNYDTIIKNINPYTMITNGGTLLTSTLENTLRQIYNKGPVNFAWIKELGHYLLDNIQFIVGDMVVDQYNGEYLHLMIYTEGHGEGKRGYDRMIGNVPELYNFDSNVKKKYMLYIPIISTFSKTSESALPLVALQFTDLFIRVKLKKFSDVAYWAPMTTFKNGRIPKLKCKMIADYFYVGNEDRMTMASIKHEPLIDIIQSNGDIVVDLSKSNTAQINLNFTSTSKEIYIVCQLLENIDGSLQYGEKQWNNYMVDVVTDTSENTVKTKSVNPIDTIQILFNGREREPTKDITYYSCLQRLKHHNISNDDGINIYSFALNPQILQPSGNANFGKIGEVELKIKFRDDVVAAIGDSKKLMRVAVYNKSINILRIMSGMAGVAFYS